MWLVVGLGNPGARYAATRHNVGFWVVEAVARRERAAPWITQGDALVAAVRTEVFECLLVKPLTFVNRSGDAVRRLAAEHAVAPDRVLAVVDDVNLEPHRLRIRAGGSDGGHNGLASLSASLGQQEFPRVRVGVGRPKMDLADYVLSEWPADDTLAARQTVDRAAAAVEVVISEGVAAAMNRFNAAPRPEVVVQAGETRNRQRPKGALLAPGTDPDPEKG